MPDRRKGGNRGSNQPQGVEFRMGDRRDSHRIPIQVEVQEGNGPFQKHPGNLSIGGVFFDRPLSLPVGAIVELRFTLPEVDKQVRVKGELVEVTPVGKSHQPGTRLRFINLDLKTELLIAKYLDEHME